MMEFDLFTTLHSRNSEIIEKVCWGIVKVPLKVRTSFSYVLLTDQHKPPTHIRKPPRPPLWRQNSNPAILPSSQGIRTAHLSHGVSNSQRDQTDAEPSPYHDRWASRLDADDQHTG
jgi:hypothetical protein